MSDSSILSAKIPSAKIHCANLSFAWPDHTAVFTDLSFSITDGRTGLVAPNGAGKSTLLRLIAGELRPTSGTVSVTGALGYLPQTLPLAGDLHVADVLGVAPVIAALNALAAGDASDAVFTAIGDDWDVEQRARAQLDRLGLAHIGLDRSLETLSGGEIVALGLAAKLIERPDVLLLDEPTNNLDADARKSLYAAIDDFGGTLLVVSHDRVLLDRMDRIAELSGDVIVSYGGGFTAYREAVEIERQAAESDLRHAEQQLRREKRQMQEARERAARRSNTAARNLSDAGLPKILAGARKRRAQESAGKADDVHAKRVGDAKSRVEDAERSLRRDDVIALHLPDTRVPAGRILFAGESLQIACGDRGLFAGNGIDLSVRGPERVALTGPNGAGKSTLLRIIAGVLEPSARSVQRAEGRVAYISQRLDLLDDELSVAENLARFAPDMTVTRSRHLLAQFLFHGERIHLPVSVLSGGERLLATLACVLYGEPAPQLLLLDEPTNNLDLVSVGQLESALTAYQGAFVVVSHDERFLAEIRVDRWLRLADGVLVEM